MRTTLRAALCAAICCAALAAQEPSPGEVRLERAILAEEVEQDTAQAIRQYRALVADDAVGADLRDLARLRLGRLLLRQGDAAAARELLTKAAANPQVRDRYRELFPAGFLPEADTGAGDDRVRAEVLALSQNLALRELRDEARSRILLFGERAVPALVAAIEAADGPGDIELVREASALIWEIGGAAARRWAEAVPGIEDGIERRAIVAGAIGSYPRLSADLAPAFRALFDDPDALIRLRLIEHALSREYNPRLPTKAALVPHLVDPDPRVRNAARGDRTLSISRIRGEESTFAKALLRLLDDESAEVDAQTEAAIRAWLSQTKFFGPDPESLDVFIALIGRQLPGQIDQVADVTAVDTTFPRDAGREGALRAARALGPIGAEPSEAQRALDRTVGLLQTTWTADAVDDAVELALLGYGPDVAWFADVASEGHWLRLRDRPEHVDISPLSSLFSVYPALEIPAAVLPAWIERVERSLRERGTRSSNPVEHLVFQIARQSAEAAIDWGYRIATRPVQPSPGRRRQDPYALEAVLGLVTGDTPRHLQALKDIALAADEAIDNRVRTIAVAWCFHRGVEDAVALFRANTVEIVPGVALAGFKDRVPAFADLRVPYTPAMFLGVEDLAGYSDEHMVAILSELLAEGSELAWGELLGSEVYVSRAADSAEFGRRWIETIAANISSAPDWHLLEGAARSVGQRILEYSADVGPALAAPCARIASALRRRQPPRAQGEGRFGDFLRRCVTAFPRATEIHEVVRECLRSDVDSERWLGWLVGSGCEPDPRLDFINAGIQDPTRPVRKEAYALAVDLAEGPARIERIRGMLQDPLVHPLSALAEVREVLDPALVPDILPLLRSESEQVRDAARNTLEAIEYYVTQQQRWQRLLAAGGIDAPSAAEALIRQAGPEQPKDVRLLALESLGTLAVAETLPFLIRTIQDGDPDIAAAARAAIRRVHDRAAPARRGPGPDSAGPRPRSGQEGDKDR